MFVRFCVCAADGTRNISAPTGAEIKVLPPSSWRQANVHRTLAFNYSSPYYTKEPDTHLGIRFFGAADGTRTRTVSLPGDFKSPVSTDSTTTAAKRYDITIFPTRQDEGCHFSCKSRFSILAGSSAGCAQKWVAPACSKSARSRKPHSTLRQGTPAFFAVSTSTSLSPT